MSLTRTGLPFRFLRRHNLIILDSREVDHDAEGGYIPKKERRLATGISWPVPSRRHYWGKGRLQLRMKELESSPRSPPRPHLDSSRYNQPLEPPAFGSPAVRGLGPSALQRPSPTKSLAAPPRRHATDRLVTAKYRIAVAAWLPFA